MDALKPFWHRKAILVLWCSLLFSAASIADIALVVRERQPMAEQLAKTIAQGLKIPSQLLTLGDKQVDWSSFDAIVLLGEPVLEAWQTPTDSPVVAVFVCTIKVCHLCGAAFISSNYAQQNSARF